MESETEKAILQELRALRSEVQELRGRLRTILVIVFFIAGAPAFKLLGPPAFAFVSFLIISALVFDHFILKRTKSAPEIDVP